MRRHLRPDFSTAAFAVLAFFELTAFLVSEEEDDDLSLALEFSLPFSRKLFFVSSLSSSWKASFTFTFVFAEVSMKAQYQSAASRSATAVGTVRADSSSHLLPTSIMGTFRISLMPLISRMSL